MAARSLLFLLLTASALAVRAQGALPDGVLRALEAAKIPAASVAIVVQDVGAPQAILRANSAVAMNPASVMKLVTTYAALEQLGPAFRWRTEAWVTGTLADGVLDGDLVLRGRGDPKLDLEAFWRLVRALRGKGLREIRGSLVLDRSHFERAAGDPGRFDGDPFRPYNVLPDALLVNYKSLRFVFVPEPERAGVRVYVEPHPPSLELINVLRLAEGGCPEGSAFRAMLKPSFDPARPRVIFSGQYPQRCGEGHLNVALLEPNDHVAGVLRQFWAESGGVWNGSGEGAVREGAVPKDARLLHVHESPPLAEIVRDTNKFSNNIMARHLFLTLGAESNGRPASAQKAAAAIRAWLAQKKIAAPELVLENGSGLSRVERISADNLAAMLQAAWKSAVMPEFIASMPLAAVDGTMRKRLKGEGVAGQAHIKTGLLAEVRGMAGYVLGRSGQRAVVVMLVNHPNAHQAQAAMDALLSWVYDR